MCVSVRARVTLCVCVASVRVCVCVSEEVGLLAATEIQGEGGWRGRIIPNATLSPPF